MYNQISCGKCSQFYENLPPSSVTLPLSFKRKATLTCFACTHRTLHVITMSPEDFPSSQGPHEVRHEHRCNQEVPTITPPSCLVCASKESQIKTTKGRKGKRKKYLCVQISFTKIFSSREKEKDVGKKKKKRRRGGMWRKGQVQDKFLTGMLTFDFSLCLIQCAISRCIIYFCVKSLTADVCHDDDDDDLWCIISRHEDVPLDMVPATCLMSRTEELPLPSPDVDLLLCPSSSR